MLEFSYEEIIDLEHSIKSSISSLEKDIRNYQSLMQYKKDQPEQLEAGEQLIKTAEIKIERLKKLLDKLSNQR